MKPSKTVTYNALEASVRNRLVLLAFEKATQEELNTIYREEADKLKEAIAKEERKVPA
jgi:hypothetical protein